MTKILYIVKLLDINECIKGTDICDHNCTNTNGSYTCHCEEGFILKDEYSCLCPSGYEVDTNDKYTCIGKQ